MRGILSSTITHITCNSDYRWHNLYADVIFHLFVYY